MISTVILTKNEEKNITSCIKSVSFTDEIIVIDNGSDDETILIAKNLGARVIDMSGVCDFSKLRNRGVKEAKNDWILFVDADERISPELGIEIIKKISFPKHLAYYIKRRDHWWGSVLTFGEVRQALMRGFIRLIHKGSGTWTGSVHEVFQSPKTIGFLKGYMDHYPHPTLKEFISNINVYSTLRAEELNRQSKTSSILEIIFFPFLKFLYTYILLLGLLDGPQGFVYSFLMSFHSFLVRSKLYIMKS